MKYTMILSIVLLGLVVGCDCTSTAGSIYTGSDEHIGGYLYRFENVEVICYGYRSDGGLQCKWK